MSLQVWLPLNGNLNNQGLANVTVTNNGGTVDSNGKIGRCYYFRTKQTRIFVAGIDVTSLEMKPGKTFSIAFWVKGLPSQSLLLAIGAWEVRYTSTYIQVYPGSNPGAANVYNVKYAVESTAEQWRHIAFTWDGVSTTLKLYVDGIYRAEQSFTADISTSYSTFRFPYIGPVYMNDFRIYDHCLSQKEVSEISKGLVLHYKLNKINTTLATSNDNMVSSLTRGSNTSVVNNSIVTSGVNSDTAFWINTTENIIPSQLYFFSCECSGIPTNAYWVFRLKNKDIQSGTTQEIVNFHMYNGYNEYVFAAPNIDWLENKILLDDAIETSIRQFVTTISNFKLYKIAATNLVTNGCGGSANWILPNSNSLSTDVPSGVAGITNSYCRGAETKEFIPIVQDHTYFMGAYAKRYSSSVTRAYLGLVPYDADKLQINPYNLFNWMSAESLTTLSQDLHDGDTVVHLTDASAWNPTQNQFYVAIFGYKDSTGYVYPDFTYTRRVYRYGRSSDKSNLDVANNRVTLLSPYSGETIPAGTAVCLSGDGATYYYPKSIAVSDDDWHYISSTFVPQNISTHYLDYAKYVRVISVGAYQYIAGITLTDLSEFADKKPFALDCSGYLNNGEITGTLQLDADSPRYDKCSNVTSLCKITTPYVPNLNLNSASIGGWFKFNKNEIERRINSISVSSTRKKPAGQLIGNCNGTTSGGLCIHYETNNVYGDGHFTTLYVYGLLRSTTPSTAASTSYMQLTDNDYDTWIHLMLTYESSNRVITLYKNGEIFQTKTYSGEFNYTNSYPFVINNNHIGSGNGPATTIPFKCSDIRVYTIALSESDVQELYHTGGYIDNKSSLECYEFMEDETTPQVNKTGIINTENLIEKTADYIYLPAKSYIDAGLFVPANTSIKAETIMRYETGGSDSRDLMGFSSSAGGYWGVKADGTWERHATFSYTDADITKLNRIEIEWPNGDAYSGNYYIGKLGEVSTYSTRNKFIYHVKLWLAGTLERDLYPAKVGNQIGMIDIVHNVFYPVQGTTASSATLGDDPSEDKAQFFSDHIEARQFIEI